MKQISIISTLLSVLLFSSCTQNEFMGDSMAEKSESQADISIMQSATFQKAMQMATQAVDFLQTGEVSKVAKTRKIDLEQTKYITRSSKTRAEGELDTLMYIFNYADNEGFVVLPAYHEIDGPLAVIESGHFTSLEECQNEGFKMFMDMAEEYVCSSIDAELPQTRGGNTGPAFLEDYKVEIDTTITNYAPMIAVRWGQNEPYNACCPYDGDEQCKAGCVAIALAQILSYHQYPTSWTLTYESGNPTISVNWSVLKQHASCSSCTDTTFCATHDPIAKIIRQIGKNTNMQYGATGSSATNFNVKVALLLWGYSSDAIQDYTFSAVESSIRNHRPVYMTGRRLDNEGEYHGHAWVVDGIRICVYTFHEYTRPINALAWTYQGSYTSTYNYLHLNWGWTGDCNGYFRAGVFNTSSGNEYDNGCSHNMAYNYCYEHEIIPNIYH